MIRTALIGLGRIAWQLEKDPLRYKPCTHAGSMRILNRKYRRPLFKISAICDQNSRKIREFKKWWQTPIVYTDSNYRKVLMSSRLDKPLDLVVVATHTDSHAEIACEALRQGVRAIVLEKPVALNLKQARLIQRAAQKTGASVWVNFERRYHPAYRLVKSYIEKKKLGHLRAIRGRVLTWPVSSEQIKTGPLLHDAIHWIDLLQWYAGVPQKIRARMQASQVGAPVEDTAFIQFDYDDFQAQLESGGRRDYFEFAIELDFESGRILSGNTGHRFFKTCKSRRYIKFNELEEFFPAIPTGNAWLGLYQEVSRTLSARAKSEPTTNLNDALAGMQILEKCYRSLRL